MEESGPGELPQLMRSLKQHLGTPTPAPTPMLTPKAEIEGDADAVKILQEDESTTS